MYLRQKVTREDAIKSIQYFQESIEKDPNYALAHTGLSNSYFVLLMNSWSPPAEIMAKARSAAEKGLELGDTSAHCALAQVNFFYNWDWPGAEKEFQKAFEFDPNDSDCHDIYSVYLSAMGRGPEAVAEAKRALELSPLLRPLNASWVSYNLRRYDDAIQYADRIIERQHDYGYAYELRGEAYLRKGNPTTALEDLQLSIQYTGRDPLVVADLVCTYAALGKIAEARNSLKELEERAPSEYVAPSFIAAAYGAIGDKDKAFEWLEKAYKERDFWLAFLIDPWFDPIRNDPRFTDLQRRMNLLH